MVQKYTMKTKRKSAGNRLASLLLGVILVAGTVVPVSAAADGVADQSAAAPLDTLFSFWSDLIDWFVDGAGYCSSAFYSSDTGLTFMGVLVVSILAFVILSFLFWWIFKLLHFL